jgi:adhesin transport system outer membrane protein
MKKKIFFTLLLALTLNAQDLKTTVAEVLSTNPIILERLKNYSATKSDITVAQSGYYPKLDINLGVGVEDTQKRNQAHNVPNTSDNYSVYQNSLKYTQNLFNGFDTTYRIKDQEYRTISAAYSYIEKVNDQSFKLVDAYLQVMKNQELLKTAQENVDIDQDIFNKVQKLFDAGLTTLSEVNKIESSLALAKSNLVVQENTILNVSFNLENILGRQLNPDEMSKPELDITLPKSAKDAVAFSVKNNPSILVSDYNIRLAKSTRKGTKSAYYPKIDIEVSESMNKNLSAIEGNNDRFRAMAFVSYNFFNGFADEAAMQKSVTKVQQEQETKNNLKRQVTQGLNLSWAANSKLQEQLVHLKEYKKYSHKTLTLYTKEYDLGRRSLLDLLSAQNDFIHSKSQIIDTEYSLLYAKYRILDAMGTLVDTVLGNKNVAYSNVNLNNKNTY